MEMTNGTSSAVFRTVAGVRTDSRGRFSARVQTWIDVLGTIFFLIPMVLLFIYMSWPVFIRTYTHGEISTNAGGLLIWPARFLVPVGFTFLLLQGLSELVKRIAFLTGAGPDPVSRHDAHAAEKELAEELRRMMEAKK